MPRSNTISPAGVKLLQEKQIAHVATVMADGSPQVTPTWVDVEPDGSQVLINTVEGWIKLRNLTRDPRIAVSVADSQNPFRCIIVRGRVVSQDREAAERHIDFLAQKYTGQPKYAWPRGPEQRVILRVRPEFVIERGV